MVRDKLNIELPFMKDTDVFVYDSSTDELTNTVVDELRSKGYTNLFYRHVDSSIHANIKFFNIYREQVENDDYEYIWLIHDHSFVTEKAFKYILNACDNHYDYMFLKFQGDSYDINEVVDLNDFLMRTAWLSTKFGACIIKTEYLEGIDFDKVIKCCCTKKRLNFAHIVFYYTLLNERKGKIGYVSFERDEFKDLLQNQKPSWNKEGIRICLECWGEVIMALPEEYTNKKEVLKSIDQWFLSSYRFIDYKEQGSWDLYRLFRYGKWIKLIRPQFYRDAFLIALFPLNYSKRKYLGRIINTIKSSKESGKKVYIFGAGKHAEEFAELLEAYNCNFDGFAVSSKQGNPDILNGKEVYVIDECGLPALYVIAVQSASSKGVRGYLDGFLEKGIEYIDALSE